MKCSKCGEECKDNQAFCLKCGTPIQVVPDFNLIEAELASNVGEMMNEINQDNKDKDKEKSIDLDFLEDETYDTLNTMNSYNNKLTKDMSEGQKKTDKKQLSSNNLDNNQNGGNNGSGGDPNTQKEKKMFKIKAIILGSIVLIIVVMAILFMTVLNKDSEKSSFTKKYNKGYDYFTAKQYDKALTEFLDAKKSADSKNQKIKVNNSIIATCENLENQDDEMIKILKELIELEPKTSDNYEKLVKIYDKKGMVDDIQKLIDSIDDVTIKTKLSDYAVAQPQFSEKEGSYDKYLSIKLSAGSKERIYYTLDDSEPTANSTEYTTEIKLDKEGKYTIKAIAVNDKGISSKVASNTYQISPSEIDGPVITPSGGQYTEEKEITVEVPEGMKCYYTYGDKAVTPTNKDTEYTAPVKMLRGKNIFSAILVSESGVVSDVTQNIYQLSISRSLTYDDALVVLKNYIVSNDIAAKVNDNDYVKKDGLIINFVYNSIVNVDSDEYYVINAVEKNSLGSAVTTNYYGVDTVTGAVVKLTSDTQNAGKYKLAE